MASRESPSNRDDPCRAPGGIIHTYQKYQPALFPSPTAPPPDMVSGAFEHLLMFGSGSRLTEEQLANAVHLDPAQIQGLGPSLDSLIRMLEERRAKILATWETATVCKRCDHDFAQHAAGLRPPSDLAEAMARCVREQQLYAMERLWYRAEKQDRSFAQALLRLMEALAEKYQVDELAAGYTFTGRTPMTVDEAIRIKEELESIDALLEQLREAMKNARLALIDMEALARFAEPGDIDQLNSLRQQVEDYLRETAGRQGLEWTREGYTLTPRAMRLFQSTLLRNIFSDLQAGRAGRHAGPVAGEGAIEMPRTRPYEFGDSVSHMDVTQSLLNAMARGAGVRNGRVAIDPDDIEIHETRNTPKCATVVIMDMSGSMRYDGQYINAKRMGLALDGLIRTDYPGDFLRFVEMYSFAHPRHISEVPKLMPKPVTIHDPVVRLRADMSDPSITEMDIPPHFTNIQHALRTARRLLAGQDTPNRQIILITDGLPTAHFEGEQLFLLYPPSKPTETATMREAYACVHEGITINIFLLPNWGQTEEDVQFAHRMAELTTGRVFFTAGTDLDRFVVWDYVQQRRSIIS